MVTYHAQTQFMQTLIKTYVVLSLVFQFNSIL